MRIVSIQKTPTREPEPEPGPVERKRAGIKRLRENRAAAGSGEGLHSFAFGSIAVSLWFRLPLDLRQHLVLS